MGAAETARVSFASGGHLPLGASLICCKCSPVQLHLPQNGANPAEANPIPLVSFRSQNETSIESYMRLMSQWPASGLPAHCGQCCLASLFPLGLFAFGTSPQA